jgi:hypothetical protein
LEKSSKLMNKASCTYPATSIQEIRPAPPNSQ